MYFMLYRYQCAVFRLFSCRKVELFKQGLKVTYVKRKYGWNSLAKTTFSGTEDIKGTLD